MIDLIVHTPPNPYPILIGNGAISRINDMIPQDVTALCIVTNTTVEKLYGESLRTQLKSQNKKIHTCVLNDGEVYKTWDSLNQIFEVMLTNKLDRRCLVLALGGGVVGDMAGMAAAIYMRGVRFVQVPTTLLAQVDSSVGGKTAINHPLGKNMIGAFHQPIAVIADTSLLNTLPDAELSAGLAEVVKHGLIADENFYHWVRDNAQALQQRDTQAISYAVQRSCQIKADFVRQDEREQGVRAYLNFGHTFGHAIETGAGYGQWLHGHAVGVGMVAASHLSLQLGSEYSQLTTHEVDQITQTIQNLGLPVTGPKLGHARYIELMAGDKKNEHGKIRFVILNRIGSAKLQTASSDQISCALNAIGGIESL